jgi:hypothetical protein
MDILKAKEVSESLGGAIRRRDDGSWIVVFERPDGRIVAILDASVEEYADLDDLAAGRCYACISLI